MWRATTSRATRSSVCNAASSASSSPTRTVNWRLPSTSSWTASERREPNQRSGHDVGAGLGDLTILVARAAGYTDRADHLAGDDDRNSAGEDHEARGLREPR